MLFTSNRTQSSPETDTTPPPQTWKCTYFSTELYDREMKHHGWNRDSRSGHMANGQHVNEANPTVKQMAAFMVQVHHTAAFIHFQHLSSLLWLTERGISVLKRPPQERWVSVVAEGSQVANLVFVAALYADMSRSQDHCGLIKERELQLHYVPGISTRRPSLEAASLDRPRCFSKALRLS